jgi:peroxiredoxin
MAQLEPYQDELSRLGASLVYIAAEKRQGMFRPEKFFADHPVAFPFLLDEDRRVTKAFGVYHRLAVDAFNIAHPATFVVDRGGVARFAYVGLDQHDRAPVAAVLEVLHGLAEARP